MLCVRENHDADAHWRKATPWPELHARTQQGAQALGHRWWPDTEATRSQHLRTPRALCDARERARCREPMRGGGLRSSAVAMRRRFRDPDAPAVASA